MRIKKFFQLLVIGGAALATSAGTWSRGATGAIGKGQADGGRGGDRDAGADKGGGTQGW